MAVDPETIRAVAQRWIDEIFTQHKLEVIDELHATDYRRHDTRSPVEGPKAYKALNAPLFNAMPDIAFTATHIVVEGDLAYIRWTATGHFTRAFLGVEPTGKEITFIGTDLLRIVDGKIVESWPCFDLLALLGQMKPEVAAAFESVFAAGTGSGS